MMGRWDSFHLSANYRQHHDTTPPMWAAQCCDGYTVTPGNGNCSYGSCLEAACGLSCTALRHVEECPEWYSVCGLFESVLR